MSDYLRKGAEPIALLYESVRGRDRAETRRVERLLIAALAEMPEADRFVAVPNAGVRYVLGAADDELYRQITDPRKARKLNVRLPDPDGGPEKVNYRDCALPAPHRTHLPKGGQPWR